MANTARLTAIVEGVSGTVRTKSGKLIGRGFILSANGALSDRTLMLDSGDSVRLHLSDERRPTITATAKEQEWVFANSLSMNWNGKTTWRTRAPGSFPIALAKVQAGTYEPVPEELAAELTLADLVARFEASYPGLMTEVEERFRPLTLPTYVRPAAIQDFYRFLNSLTPPDDLSEPLRAYSQPWLTLEIEPEPEPETVLPGQPQPS